MGPWRSPVAHLHGMQGVRGSNPLGSTKSPSQTAIPKPEQGIWDGRSTVIRHFLLQYPLFSNAFEVFLGGFGII
ncbi:MAG: hypothetical protein JWP30_2118 [Homoserinimonas sp.]|nr:hypothetical protein [Homoserinimonas sp.]